MRKTVAEKEAELRNSQVAYHPDGSAKFPVTYSQLLPECERLRAWIQRTASDDNLEHRAGYHGRRVKREAMAVLCVRTIP